MENSPQPLAVAARIPIRTRVARSNPVRIMRATWFQARTKNYLHAFVDGWLSFFVVIIFVWGVLALEREGKPIEHWGILEVSNFQRVMVAGNLYLSFVFSTTSGIAIGLFMKSLGSWKLRYPEGKGKRIVFGSVQLPVWVYVCMALAISFILPMLASQSMMNLSYIPEVDETPNGPPIFHCRPQWYVVLAAMCSITLAAITSGAIIRVRCLTPVNEGLQSRDEKNVEIQSAVDVPPAGMV